MVGLLALAFVFSSAGFAHALSFASQADYDAYMKASPEERMKYEEKYKANPKPLDIGVGANTDARIKMQSENGAKSFIGGILNREKPMDDSKKVVPTNVRIITNTEGKVEVANNGNVVENFKNRIEIVIKNLEATYSRLTQLADRVETRLEKVATEEKTDLTENKKALSAARENLRLAKSAIESAKTAFRTESTAVASIAVKANAVQTNNGNPNEIWGTEIYNKCKINGGEIKASTPARCSMDGMTYVNSDEKIMKDDSMAQPKKEEIRGKLTKTIEYIKIAKENLIKAHRNLVQAIKGVGVGANTSARVN